MKKFLQRALSLLPLVFLSGCSGEGTANWLSGANLSPAMLLILQVVCLVSMVFGLFSLFIYIIPGLTIIWLTVLVYGLITGASTEALIFFGIITTLMLFGNSLDQLLMGSRVRKYGAKWSSIILSMLAAFIFSILFPPFGGLIAALIVLFTLEYIRLRDLRQAGGSTREMAIGCATALIARFGIGLLMIGVWGLWVWYSGALPF